VTNLHVAMLAVTLEDRIGKPCVVCGVPARIAGLWMLSKECLAREFGTAEGKRKAIAYSLCTRCAKKVERSRSFLAKVEDVMVRMIREAHS
jgi:hypothetical protein